MNWRNVCGGNMRLNECCGELEDIQRQLTKLRRDCWTITGQAMEFLMKNPESSDAYLAAEGAYRMIVCQLKY